MTAADSAPDRPPAEEHAAHASPVEDASLVRDAAGGAASVGAGGMNADEDGDLEPDAHWLHGDELRSLEARWRDIQASFVDEPSRAVAEADTLVADLMQRLAHALYDQRAALEARWAGRDDVSTEELRQGLRRYRSMFERLLVDGW